MIWIIGSAFVSDQIQGDQLGAEIYDEEDEEEQCNNKYYGS